MNALTDADGRILHPERYHRLPPSDWWYVMFEAATGSVIDDHRHNVLVYDLSKKYPIHTIDFSIQVALPLIRH